MANYSKNKKYHYTYKTTNLINERYYLGMHSTNRLDDGYLGSGKRLYYELNKYGRDNFKFKILKHFKSREELVQAEIKLITEEDLSNPNCLNLKSGGSGGLVNKLHLHKLKAGARAYMKEKWKDQEFKKHISEAVRLQRKKEINEGRYSSPNRGHWKGRKHKPESIQKMKESAKGRSKGDKNSQYGTCWITNNIENKKIRKGDAIPEGWELGRKLK